MRSYNKRAQMLIQEIEDLAGDKHPEDRQKEYGHPKELMEKLHQSCTSVKLTLESVPKIVDRLE